MKCKKCGAEMLGEVIATYPPIHRERCPQCGYTEESSEAVEATAGTIAGTIVSEPIETKAESKTDWQSVRNQAAIAIMQAALSNDCLREAIANNGKENGIKAFDNIIEFAVSGAIGLVEKLKKEE